MSLHELPTGELEPVLLPYRNADMLYALSQEFERAWKSYTDSTFATYAHRPSCFPPVFRSKWDLAWRLRCMDDDQARELLRLLQLDPVDVAQYSLSSLRADALAEQSREHIASTMTPAEVAEAGFPRIWKESA